jgi:hypothetical protein
VVGSLTQLAWKPLNEFQSMIKILESLKYVPNKKAPDETGAQVHRRVGNQ